MNINDHFSLQLQCQPEMWKQIPNKIPLLMVAINTPSYYSLAVRILTLWVHEDPLLKEKYDVRFIEINKDQGLSDLVKAIAAWKPALIGLSVHVWNQQNCIDLASSIKDVSPGTTIICGGQEVTNSFINYLEEVPAFDYVIDGEGEIPLRQLLTCWDSQKGLEGVDIPKEISGLWYRDNGRICFTRAADLVESLDDIPSVVLADLVPVNPRNVLGVMLEGTRGCPFRCSFCFEGYKKCKVRSASVDRVISEMRYMAQQGALFFHIMDPILFNNDIRRIKDMAAALKEIKDHHHCFISIEAYADQINEQNIEYLKLFSVLDLGLQTINPETLTAIHRRYSPEKFEHGLALLRGTKATTNIYLISGLPYETSVTFLKGVQFVMDQKPSRFFCNELMLLNGTELREKAKEYGYVFNPAAPYDVYSNTWITREELLTIQSAGATLSARYNLASRKSYVESLGLSTGNHADNGQFYCQTGCTHGCPGCQTSHPQPYEKQKESLERLLKDDLNRLDVFCGNSFLVDELFQLLAHTHLAEINHLQMIVPCDAPIDTDTLCKCFQFGVLHYKVYIKPDRSYKGLEDAVEQSMKNLTSVVKFGVNRMKPFVEVVLLAEDMDFTQLTEIIEDIMMFTPNIIAVIDNGSVFDSQWHKVLAAQFVKARARQVWLKLPVSTFTEVFSDLPEKEALIAQLKNLDLVSLESEFPPCYVTG